MKAVILILVLALSQALTASGTEAARTAGHDSAAPTPGSYTLPIIKDAADGALLDSTGKTVHLRDLTRGRVTVLSFIYTRCADAKACPAATGVLLDLHGQSAEDRALARGLRLVSMSFDPAHDTPQRMAGYAALAAERRAAAPWHFLTAPTQADLQPILAAYGQAVDKKQNAADPLGPLSHTVRVFLIDRAGKVRNIYSTGTLDARLILADVRTLLLEAPALR